MANQFKVNDIVTITNIKDLYSSFEDMIGKTGMIMELEPYFPPPIKIKFPAQSTFAFYDYNIRPANQMEILKFNSELVNDPWRTV